MSYQAPTGQQNVGDPGNLNLPYYGIGFVDAIKRGFAKYVRFDGRASRSEYWWWALFAAIVPLVLSIINAAVASGAAQAGQMSAGSTVLSAISGLWGLVLLVPNLAIAWRRLHDTNKSGLFILLGLIPFVGWIIVLVLMLMPSDPAGARYDR